MNARVVIDCQDRRLALLLAHVFFNRGPYPYDMKLGRTWYFSCFKEVMALSFAVDGHDMLG